jgi:hypothetical protein
MWENGGRGGEETFGGIISRKCVDEGGDLL